LKRKVLPKIVGPITDILSGEWWIRKYNELETLVHKPSTYLYLIPVTIRNKISQWAEYACMGIVIKSTHAYSITEENPTSKRPLGKPSLRL